MVCWCAGGGGCPCVPMTKQTNLLSPATPAEVQHALNSSHVPYSRYGIGRQLLKTSAKGSRGPAAAVQNPRPTLKAREHHLFSLFGFLNTHL